MVQTYGEAAPTAIQMAMMRAVERNDMPSYRGWANIQFALTDLWRGPFPEETLH